MTNKQNRRKVSPRIDDRYLSVKERKQLKQWQEWKDRYKEEKENENRPS